MNEEEKYQLIESYLRGTLEGEKLTDFEQRLEENSTLRQELQLHRELNTELADASAIQFNEQLKKIDRSWKAPAHDIQSIKEPAKRTSILIYLTAIAACLLLGLYIFKGFFHTDSSEQLFADHFEPYKMILTQRNSNQGPDEVSKKLKEATQAYIQKDFNQAAILFKEMSQDDTNKPVYRFYYAQSLLANDQTAEAISELKYLSEVQGSMLQEHAVWYLGLAHLEVDDLTSSKTTLSKIKSNQFKFEAAQKILADLK